MDFLSALITLAPSIVAIATLVFAYFQNRDNNNRQLTQQREQQQHEEKKAEIESKLANERATKERLQDVYANAVRSLAEIMIVKEHAYSPKDLADRTGDAQKWLSLVVIYYYGDRESADFKQFYTSLIILSPQDTGFDGYIDHLRRCVIEFAKNDPRLK